MSWQISKNSRRKTTSHVTEMCAFFLVSVRNLPVDKIAPNLRKLVLSNQYRPINKAKTAQNKTGSNRFTNSKFSELSTIPRDSRWYLDSRKVNTEYTRPTANQIQQKTYWLEDKRNTTRIVKECNIGILQKLQALGLYKRIKPQLHLAAISSQSVQSASYELEKACK